MYRRRSHGTFIAGSVLLAYSIPTLFLSPFLWLLFVVPAGILLIFGFRFNDNLRKEDMARDGLDDYMCGNCSKCGIHFAVHKSYIPHSEIRYVTMNCPKCHSRNSPRNFTSFPYSSFEDDIKPARFRRRAKETAGRIALCALMLGFLFISFVINCGQGYYNYDCDTGDPVKITYGTSNISHDDEAWDSVIRPKCLITYADSKKIRYTFTATIPSTRQYNDLIFYFGYNGKIVDANVPFVKGSERLEVKGTGGIFLKVNIEKKTWSSDSDARNNIKLDKKDGLIIEWNDSVNAVGYLFDEDYALIIMTGISGIVFTTISLHKWFFLSLSAACILLSVTILVIYRGNPLKFIFPLKEQIYQDIPATADVPPDTKI